MIGKLNVIAATSLSATPSRLPPPSLRSGPSGVLPHARASLGVLQGSLPLRHLSSLGPCEVRCKEVSLWPLVALMFGFELTRVCFCPSPMVPLLRGFLSSVGCRAFVTSGRPRGGGSPGLILGDFESLPALGSRYWASASAVHVFSGDSLGSSVAWPSGWHHSSLTLRHSHVGGATTGVHTLHLLAPTAASTEPRPHVFDFDKLPWSAIDRSLAPRERARALPAAPSIPSNILPRVYASSDWCVSSWGLFPAGDWRRSVVVPSLFSPSGWGTRRLNPQELASLHDVPILLQDHIASSGSPDLLLMFLQSPPGKILSLGADLLLSRGVRGGFSHWETNSSTVQLPSAGGKRAVHTGEGGPVSKRQCVGAGLTDDVVLKQDGQKHDDAPVPLRIWDGMFLETIPPGMPTLFPTNLHPNWRAALNRWRGALIGKWQKYMLRSFFVDVRSRAPAPIRASLPRPETLVQLSWTADGRPTYTWSPGGRQSFQRAIRQLLNHPSTSDDWSPARECLLKVGRCTWWDWRRGSRLFFWHWKRLPYTIVWDEDPSWLPPWARGQDRLWARDGQPHFQIADFPHYRRPQRPPRTSQDRILVQSKVNPVRIRDYIEVGEVVSLAHYFYVPKGDTDIRMVYNGTSCGLNDCLFAPHFGLPYIEHCARSLLPGYYQADIDIGEMFLNFMLGKEVRKYAGVDVSALKCKREDLPADGSPPTWWKEEGSPLDWEQDRTKSWERWVRNFMGMRDSPWRSIQMLLIAKVIAYGDRKDPNNPFQWESAILNLPGSWNYDPTLPWVYKLRVDLSIANEIYVYVDDGRVCGASKSLCWGACRRFSSICAKLGIQDAARKRTEPSQTPGPWAGSIMHTVDSLTSMVSQKKWDKVKSIVRELDHFSTQLKVPRNRLEIIRGFLNYVARTYKWMVPYMKCLHLTIDGWREGRGKDGWKVKKPRGRFTIWEWEGEKWIDVGPEYVEEAADEVATAPEMVEPVQRFRSDVEALLELTEPAHPPTVLCRAKRRLSVCYLMGDASGRGFGSSMWGSDGIRWESGNYASTFRSESSNWREADHLVLKLEELWAEGKLEETEVFTFTDNAVFEGTFYKGHSKSKKLNDIILRLRRVERQSSCILHVIHIAGTRMKAAGVDGLSRGDLMEGMMRSGSDPMQYVPLNEDADTRSGGAVCSWVNSWWCDSQGRPWCHSHLKCLTPDDWFSLYTVDQPRLWVPPPAAMHTVLELFCEDRFVNPHIPHVFVIPRLMTHLWRKNLAKDADLMFTVPVGVDFWPKDMHEPLIVAIVLPIVHVPNYRGPWVVHGTPESKSVAERLDRGLNYRSSGRHDPDQLHDMEGDMSGVRQAASEWSRDILFEFLISKTSFPPVQQCLVRRMLPPGHPRPFPHPEGGKRGSKRSGSRKGSGRRPPKRAKR